MAYSLKLILISYSDSVDKWKIGFISAYVVGEKSGIIMETPFKMSETLNGKNDLNINEEKKMIQERHRQLVIDKANEETISSDMKDFGIQRFLTISLQYGKPFSFCLKTM